MTNFRPLIIVGGVGIIGYALYRYYLKQIGFLKEITYQVVGVRVRSVSTTNVSLDITTRIYNSSNVEATVKEMFLDFYVNNVKVGNVTEIKDIVVLPTKTTDISFNFSFNPSIIGKNLLDIISLSVAAKDVMFDLRGYIKVNSAFITTTIPFEYQNNFKSLIKK